jgi:hypothetical protein
MNLHKSSVGPNYMKQKLLKYSDIETYLKLKNNFFKLYEFYKNLEL